MRELFRKDNKLKYKLSLLKPDRSKDEAYKEFCLNRVKYSFAVFIIIIFLAIVSLLKNGLLRDKSIIKRGEYNEFSQIITRDYRIGKYSGSFDIEVSNKEYSDKEITEIFGKIKSDLPELILGENESLNAIRKPLNLVKSFNEVVSILWHSENNDLIGTDGNINNTDIAEAGEAVRLEYLIQYLDKSIAGEISVRVLPPIYTEEEAIYRALKYKASESEKQDRTNDNYILPQEINGLKVIWGSSENNYFFPLLFLAIILSFLAYFLQEKKLDENIKDRRKQMLNDYYEIVNKLILYINVGVSVKTAFQKMAEEYLDRRNKKLIKFKYAYEELIIMCRKIDNGLSEAAAYELCGKRSELIQYKKLFGYVNQSIKKGSGFVVEKLTAELKEAFELRKANAVKIGEEATTKLMLPMIIMLIIVIGILIIPAFTSFEL